MADNVELNPGTGGAVVATDDDGTAQHQYVKMEWGNDGTFTKVASGASAVPIQDGDNSITVDGTVSVTGVALAANQPGFGSAGAPSANVVSVQGVVGGQAVICNVTTLSPGSSGGSLGKAEDAVHGSGDVGVAVWARRIDTLATSAGTSGDYCTFNQSAEGGLWVTPTPSASAGLSIFRSIDLDESEEEVKSSAGTVYGMWVTNTASSTRWVKFYNATAANVTVGTTTPVITIAIPGNDSDDISGNFGPGGMGIGFDTAISVAATTGVADNDTGAPGANEVIINVFYK